ncbi:Phox-associated domain Phox-like Sorting nexin C-terminal putative isoform 1 [Tripterygium wilfordii]|uniref:Phox-associated domain Phox-like Sorting nexin C-terminal putative isoform 1 n=1 Tax=Tripterygium wilfordii TaxID=458696 RepID=A0A7J7DXM8_TRIWF|nr:uncharacterized protein LOC120014599 [Tripterygium wilfordii]KAF5751138.1 Phox-associated domain Phox-like Sorting nexin C-terminal putative isoform 1 [Tripterygium wilfordii]
MKAMETIQDLIEELKVRTLWWALCIFAVTYFLSHTSSSMLMNLPISILFVSALRILCNEVQFSWKARTAHRQTYLSHLEKKQLSVNDSRLSTAPPPPKWKRKIDSPIVEAAITDFINKILQDFVTDLWYSDITPDREAPRLMHAVIMDAIGEISGRVKEINLVDLLTKDVVDLVGDHLDLFRRNQAAVGVEVMGTLSSEERDERLKYHLSASKELHPALISPESEYKVLQQLIGGLLAVVLRPREANVPLIRCISRELVTCLVMQPLMNLASPGYINELIESILLAFNDDSTKEVGGSQSAGGRHNDDLTATKFSSLHYQGHDMASAKVDDYKDTSVDQRSYQELLMQPRPADWAQMLEVATQRRTEVLMPENLENMWTKGRNYKKKEQKKVKNIIQEPIAKGSGSSAVPARNSGKEGLTKSGIPTGKEQKPVLQLAPDMLGVNERGVHLSQNLQKQLSVEEGLHFGGLTDSSELVINGNRNRLKRSNSASVLNVQPDMKKVFAVDDGGPIISEFYSPDFGSRSEDYSVKRTSDMLIHSVGLHVPKLRCRVLGAYFENLGSKSFAVYSIAVTDAENRTWFVKRRYRNFERLHRHLKDIPNYTLHLPPKRIFSSSTEDAFVHQRCIQLDKYLQDLLSIANVAEQHEVWDFLSISSKNYSFGKSSSVMKTLAVNVDDAVDDIVRQFKGVSDGLVRKVAGASPLSEEASSSISSRHVSLNSDEMNKSILRQNMSETANTSSDNEADDKEVRSSPQGSGWHSDNELISKSFPPRVVNHGEESRNSVLENTNVGVKSECSPMTNLLVTSFNMEDPIGMPPEWTPPNVSVPLLNLVDKVFQLKRRGWLRRQVFWISKQILQLVMEDAIDDWLLRQIYLLRREETIAQGIRWIQDALWPDGTFFTRVGIDHQNKEDDPQLRQQPFQTTSSDKVSKPGSFEQQLEAARRASDVKKMLFDGAPTTLVSLIGHKQYRRCAKDIYYFTQSTICIKQLSYGILELLLVSVFPELRDLVLDIHQKMHVGPL